MARPKKIVIENYNPDWPRLYVREKALVQRAMGGHLLATEHVGSTAVDGLGGKPIIDILAGVRSLSDGEECIGLLQAVGFEFRADALEDMPEDRYFEKWIDGIEIAHLHVTEHLGRFWTEHVLFRDFLRSHSEDAKEYEALKRRLAPQFSSGYEYARAKTDFIRSAIARARAEAPERH